MINVPLLFYVIYELHANATISNSLSPVITVPVICLRTAFLRVLYRWRLMHRPLYNIIIIIIPVSIRGFVHYYYLFILFTDDGRSLSFC